jgi:S1-C subfamily serine protease
MSRIERTEDRRSAILAAALMLFLAVATALTGRSEVAAAISQTTTATAAQQQTTASVADVAEAANKAVVTVTNLQNGFDPFNRGQQTGEIPVGVGSGYIIDTDGHVVTNSHVVQGGNDFEVQFYDGTTVDATLVGQDVFQDVAVLQLDLKGGQSVPGTLAFGDSDKVRAGDQVIAIGSPYGDYTNTVSDGIVGAVDRDLATGAGYDLPNLLQHDAPIYPGNSGGPLLDMNGKVIGMNVAKAVTGTLGNQMDANIGFAIESNAVKPIVDEIIKTGEYARPYLGIRSQPQPDGPVVVSVERGSPADNAGLQPGDVITAVDRQAIDRQHSFIDMLIFEHRPGDKVDLTVDRNGQSVDVTVTLGERPADTN